MKRAEAFGDALASGAGTRRLQGVDEVAVQAALVDAQEPRRAGASESAQA